MFSDCSGTCISCTAFGGSCLAGHGDDYYQLIDKGEALRRLVLKKTPGGRPYTEHEIIDLSKIAGAENPGSLPMQVTVNVSDLRIMASMGCEHVNHGGKSCDSSDLKRGGCCNTCWSSRWAKRLLKEAGW